MASRKDIEAGRAHVLLYIKNQVQAGLQVAAQNLKQFAAVTTQVAGRFNQLASIATMAGGAILGPMIAAVTQLEEAKGPLDDIKKALADGIGRPLLPLLQTVRDIVVRFGEWAKQNPEIVRNVAKIGAILIGVGIAAKIAASAFMLIAGAATIASVAASAIAFFMSPTGVVVLGALALAAALTAGIAAWLKFTESGKRASAAIASGFREITMIVKELFRLLVAGEWEVAGQILGKAIMTGFFGEIAKWERRLPKWLGDLMGWPALTKATSEFGDLVNMRVKALRSINAFGGGGAAAVAPAGVAALHPQQTAMTTHEALALTFGTKQQVPRNEETQILKEIRGLLKNGLDKDAALLQDLLKEMRRGGPKFGK